MKKRVHILIMTLMLIVACVGCSGSSDNPPPANSLAFGINHTDISYAFFFDSFTYC